MISCVLEGAVEKAANRAAETAAEITVGLPCRLSNSHPAAAPVRPTNCAQAGRNSTRLRTTIPFVSQSEIWIRLVLSGKRAIPFEARYHQQWVAGISRFCRFLNRTRGGGESYLAHWVKANLHPATFAELGQAAGALPTISELRSCGPRSAR
jgi:hypothetical protein